MKTLVCATVLILTACAASDSNLIVSPDSPDLTLRIDHAFRPLSPLTFPIENLTDVERRVFVDASANGTVERMIVVQFEKAQKGSDFRFVFPSTPPRRFGAHTYRAGTFVYDEVEAAAGEPAREAARTRRHLEQNGLRPPRVWKVARLARVADPQGLSEVIVFYFENADGEFSGTLPEELITEEHERLFAALEQAIAVVRG
jgi:hypothetical protein